jgi:hypothetical protein
MEYIHRPFNPLLAEEWIPPLGPLLTKEGRWGG